MAKLELLLVAKLKLLLMAKLKLFLMAKLKLLLMAKLKLLLMAKLELLLVVCLKIKRPRPLCLPPPPSHAAFCVLLEVNNRGNFLQQQSFKPIRSSLLSNKTSLLSVTIQPGTSDSVLELEAHVRMSRKAIIMILKNLTQMLYPCI